MDAESVEKVIVAAYAVGDENSRRAAVAWLNEFGQRPEAWHVSLTLLGARSVHVQFFAGNMLYHKVTKEWSSQAPETKQDLHARVGHAVRLFVEQGTVSAKVLRRLVLVLARIAVQSPALLDGYVSEALRLVQLGLGEGDGGAAPVAVRERALLAGTEYLVVLPEESEDQHAPSADGEGGASGSGSGLARRAASALDPGGGEARLRALAPRVLDAATRLAAAGNAYLSRALEVLQRWPAALPALRRVGLLRPVLMTLLECRDLDVLEGAAQALVACVAVPSYEQLTGQPESEAAQQAFREAVQATLALAPRIASTSARVARAHPDNAPAAASAADDGSGSESESGVGEAEADAEAAEREALCLCRAAVAVAEHELGRAAALGAEAPHAHLPELVMALSGHASRNVAVLSLNFWLLVQDIPMMERSEWLREPCFLQLLDVLLRQSQLNRAAHTGADDDVDDAVQGFRTGTNDVREPLVVAYFVLGPRFVALLLGLLRSASRWKPFEAALFALGAASREVVHALGAQGGAGGPRAAETRLLVEQLLQELPSMPLLLANGATLRAGVQLVGDLARPLARMSLSSVERCLGVAALALPVSAPLCLVVGQCLLKVCTACRLELALHPDAVKALASGVENAYRAFPSQGRQGGCGGDDGKDRDAAEGGQHGGPSGCRGLADGCLVALPLAARLDIVQGLTRVASCMPAAQCADTLAALLTPGLERLRAAVDRQVATAAVAELEVLRCAVKFVDPGPATGGGGGGSSGNNSGTSSNDAHLHPAAGVLASALPLLDRIYAAPRLRSDSEVVDALYALLSTAFLSAREVLRPHVAALLQSAVRQFEATRQPSCVVCVGRAVEVFGSEPAAAQGFAEVAAQLCTALVSCIRGGQAEDESGAVAAFFDAAQLFLLFCPSALFDNRPPQASSSASTTQDEPQLVDVLLQLAAHALQAREEAPYRAALSFVSSLLHRAAEQPAGAAGAPVPGASPRRNSSHSAAAPQLLERHQAVVVAALQRQGRGIVEPLMLALVGAGTAPPYAQARAADLLGDLSHALPQAAQGWVYAALVRHPQAFAALEIAGKEQLVQAVAEMRVSAPKAREVFAQVAACARKSCTARELIAFLHNARAAMAEMASVPISRLQTSHSTFADLIDLS